MRAGPALAVLIFVLVVFVAPLCEEIVYRGLLWGAVERWAPSAGGARDHDLLFALAHFEFTRTPLLLVVAIPIGIARVITGRLPAGVIAHQINNLLPGVVLMGCRRAPGQAVPVTTTGCSAAARLAQCESAPRLAL